MSDFAAVIHEYESVESMIASYTDELFAIWWVSPPETNDQILIRNGRMSGCLSKILDPDVDPAAVLDMIWAPYGV